MSLSQQTFPTIRLIDTPFTAVAHSTAPAVDPQALPPVHEQAWETVEEYELFAMDTTAVLPNEPMYRAEILPPPNIIPQHILVMLTAAILIILAFALWVGPWRAAPTTTLATTDPAPVSSQDNQETRPGVGPVAEAAVAEPPGNSGLLAPLFTPEVHHWEALIVRWAQHYGVDPNMVATIMQIESCGNPEAVSRSNAQGLFQVMPFHFQPGEEMRNPELNAQRGVNYFAERLAQTNGDVGRAFAGYNGGHVAAAADWNQWMAETQRYFTWSTGIYEDATLGRSSSDTLQRWLAAGGDHLCRQAAAQLGLP